MNNKDTQDNWRLEYFAGYSLPDCEPVWRTIASGDNRLHAAAACLVCLFARPDLHYRMTWRQGYTKLVKHNNTLKPANTIRLSDVIPQAKFYGIKDYDDPI